MVGRTLVCMFWDFAQTPVALVLCGEPMLEVIGQVGRAWLCSVYGDEDRDGDLLTQMQRFLYQLVTP